MGTAVFATVPVFEQFAWDANPAGENVTNYRMYYGNASGVYNGSHSPINVGNVTTAQFVPDMGVKTYIALTAQNAQGESAFSTEITYG
jgi:hypothetical protein